MTTAVVDLVDGRFGRSAAVPRVGEVGDLLFERGLVDDDVDERFGGLASTGRGGRGEEDGVQGVGATLRLGPSEVGRQASSPKPARISSQSAANSASANAVRMACIASPCTVPNGPSRYTVSPAATSDTRRPACAASLSRWAPSASARRSQSRT